MHPRPCLGPLTPGLGSRVGVGGLGLTKLTTGKVTGTACLDLRVWEEIYSTFHWAQSPLIEAIQLRNPSSLRAQLYSITTEQQRSYTARRITSGLNQCCVPLGWTRKSLSCKALVINNHFINLLTFLSKWFYIILL